MQLPSVFSGPDREEPRGPIIRKGLGSNQILENKQYSTLCMQTSAVWIKGAEFAASEPANVKLVEKIQHGPKQTSIKGNVTDLLFLQWKLKDSARVSIYVTPRLTRYPKASLNPPRRVRGLV